MVDTKLISKLQLVYSQSSVRHNDTKFHFFSFLIWMCTFQTDNRTFKIRITTVDQFSLDCCSGVLISTLSKYLSEKLYHYTNHDFFQNTISCFITFCHLLYTCQYFRRPRIFILYIRCRLTQPNIGEQWELSIIVILHQK